MKLTTELIHLIGWIVMETGESELTPFYVEHFMDSNTLSGEQQNQCYQLIKILEEK